MHACIRYETFKLGCFAGLDAVARQGLRTLLRRAKQNTALLLTTHFMDEADVLSDEVVILAAGRLACHGPSLALKAMRRRLCSCEHDHDPMRTASRPCELIQVVTPDVLWPQERYGDGYMLTVTAAVDQPVDAEAISSMITQHVGSATLQRACGGELVFRLPTASATSAALPELLDALDGEGVV